MQHQHLELKDGMEKGKSEKTLEIAKKLIKEKMSIEFIEKITGLTKEEIQKLQWRLGTEIKITQRRK